MKTYTTQHWYDLSKDLYELIINEIDSTSDYYLPEVYPDLVVMYEFFRLVRGDHGAFRSVCPPGMAGEGFQKEIYKMEYDLAEKLKPLEKKLDIKDGRTSANLDIIRKSFSLKYFNQE